MILMFFIHILLIWSEVQIMQISCFISCCQLSQQNMSLLHFQQLWVVMMILICWSDYFLRVITNWCKMLNELSFQMTIWVHMCRDSFFVWLLVISWIFSWVFSWVVVFSDFMCSSRSYFLIWNHMQTFILCLCDIFVILEYRAFCFITSQSTCSFNQQNYSHQSVAIVLSWNHVHQLQFIIQIWFMNSVCKSCRMKSHSSTHSLCCL